MRVFACVCVCVCTCAVVPHGRLLEESVDLQHLRVFWFALQLLHLAGSGIKLSLSQHRRKHTDVTTALIRTGPPEARSDLWWQVRARHLREAYGLGC